MPYSRKVRYLIGIDEAGRGPLAGPIVIAGIKVKSKIPPSLASYGRAGKNQSFGRLRIDLDPEQGRMGQKSKFRKIFRNIKDSKKLTAKQREEWFRRLTNHPEIEWAVTKVWPKTIDRINIARAADLGTLRVYKKLTQSSSTNYESYTNILITNSYIRRFVKDSLFVDEARRVLLDGGLKLPQGIEYTAIIRGDERVPVIAAASIIAKVTRDRIMARLHKKYPRYRFDLHKGYATQLHRRIVRRIGQSAIHRRTFRV